MIDIDILPLQGIEGELKSCSDQFKAFERQDLKYQEDLKHVKQKLKKLEEKIAKVIPDDRSCIMCF